jgi:hypothetical protein
MKTFYTFLVFSFLINNLFSQYYTSFESKPEGAPYNRAAWQSDGFITDNWDNGLESRTSVDTTVRVTGSKSLRIAYPMGKFGPANTGCQIPLTFSPSNQMYISYWLRFSENFSWGNKSKGGKLPGLAGGDRCSGGETCDGTNGFSARFMWRKGGQAVLYLYHMDKPGKYGEDMDLIYPSGENFVFERGKWYHLMERVRINTNGSTYDGEVEVWVNGQQVLLKKGLRFTSNGDKVDNLYISTFHGGSDDTWAPENDCFIWLDDVRISTDKNGLMYNPLKTTSAPQSLRTK